MVLRLERMRDEGKYKTIETLSQFSNDKQAIEKRIDRLLNFFIISPLHPFRCLVKKRSQKILTSIIFIFFKVNNLY